MARRPALLEALRGPAAAAAGAKATRWTPFPPSGLVMGSFSFQPVSEGPP